jgi:major membrane immunogen (membrane-anchored lipoprotein)
MTFKKTGPLVPPLVLKVSVLFIVSLVSIISMISTGSCSVWNPKDGYYTAETVGFDRNGWKEYITVYVSNNKIVTVEYGAKNSSGFIKSWDMDYMRNMSAIVGVYPNKYARSYSVDLLNRQDPAKIDAISGATDSYISFCMLASAVIEQSRTGTKKVIAVEIPEQ